MQKSRRPQAPKSPPSHHQVTNYPATMAILAICIALNILCTICPALELVLATGPLNPLSLLTYQFAHAGWMHLIGNFMFGLPFMAFLESCIGSKRLVLWYILSGLASALFFELVTGTMVGLIGSSGSISGMAMGACLLFGKKPADRLLGALMGSLMLGMQVLLAIEMALFSNVAYWGHVGGMLCGALLVLGDLWKKPLKRLSSL